MFTYDLTTDVGKVRLLIPDRLEDEVIFQDAEIQAFIDLETTVRTATALALETIASDQALVLKVIKILDLTTDGAKVSDALLKRAQVLRDTDDDDEAGYSFDIAEMVVDPHTETERLVNEVLRGS